jgi:uncharacterized integral membrane protein (TIGR00698 family)
MLALLAGVIMKLWLETHARGLALAVIIAAAAQFLSEHYGGPAMLFALLIGMSFHFMAHEQPTEAGIAFAARDVLRLGVALLGLRIAFSDIAALGLANVEAIIGLVILTIVTGMVLARLLARRSWHYGALTGGAVAICGASAALAITAVLPRNKISEQDTLLTVVGVTTLSTLAMILYPAIFSAIGLTDAEAGFLVGATIHDVAQVVGAGYSISNEAGDTATIVKLMRVALLPVVLIAFTLAAREGGRGQWMPPWFLIGFIALMLLANLVALPVWLTDAASTASRAFLLVAVAALGVKTSLAELRKVGAAKMAVILAATVVLLVGALAYVLLAR